MSCGVLEAEEAEATFELIFVWHRATITPRDRPRDALGVMSSNLPGEVVVLRSE